MKGNPPTGGREEAEQVPGGRRGGHVQFPITITVSSTWLVFLSDSLTSAAVGHMLTDGVQKPCDSCPAEEQRCRGPRAMPGPDLVADSHEGPEEDRAGQGDLLV